MSVFNNRMYTLYTYSLIQLLLGIQTKTKKKKTDEYRFRYTSIKVETGTTFLFLWSPSLMYPLAPFTNVLMRHNVTLRRLSHPTVTNTRRIIIYTTSETLHFLVINVDVYYHSFQTRVTLVDDVSSMEENRRSETKVGSSSSSNNSRRNSCCTFSSDNCCRRSRRITSISSVISMITNV